MIRTFYKYIEQRMSLWQWLALSVYIPIFVSGMEFSSSRLLLGFLFTAYLFVLLRLYDDLMSRREDRDKTPPRIYTKTEPAKQLWKIFILLWVIPNISIAFFSIKGALILFSFIILNHILYLFLHQYYFFKHLLPLLKYGFMGGLISFHFVGYNTSTLLPTLMISLSLFIYFVIFERLQDNQFSLDFKFLYLLAPAGIIALSGVDVSIQELAIVSSFSFAVILAIKLLKGSPAGYISLILLLTYRLFTT